MGYTNVRADIYEVFRGVVQIRVDFLEKIYVSKSGYIYKKKYVTGTAFPIKKDDRYIWFITAGHVLNKGLIRNIGIRSFWPKTQEYIRAELEWFEYEKSSTIYKDVGLVRVDLRYLEDKEFSILELANQLPKNNQYISTCGFEGGRKPVLFFSYVDEIYSNKNFRVDSGYINGHSGSPILDFKANKVYGIALRSDGTTMSSKYIREVLKSRNLIL